LSADDFSVDRSNLLCAGLPSLSHPSREPSDHEAIANGDGRDEVMRGSEDPQDSEYAESPTAKEKE
jgi:hypothetical protein